MKKLAPSVVALSVGVLLFVVGTNRLAAQITFNPIDSAHTHISFVGSGNPTFGGFAWGDFNTTQPSIANPTKTYPVYTDADLVSAMSAAVSGDTVLLCNPTFSGQVIFKDGVNIVGRIPATITFNSASNGGACTDNGGEVNCYLENVTFIRNKPSGAPSNAFGIHIGNESSCITGKNVYGRSSVSSGISIAGTGDGLHGESSNGHGIACAPTTILKNSSGKTSVAGVNQHGIFADGTVDNCTGENTGTGDGINVQTTGIIRKCTGISATQYGIYNNGKAYNCIGVGNATEQGFINHDYAEHCEGTSSSPLPAFVNHVEAVGCIGYSTGGYGFQGKSGSISVDCDGFSSSTIGAFFENNAVAPARAINCSGRSNNNFGMYAGEGVKLVNCTAYSSSHGGLFIDGDNVIVVGGSFASDRDDAFGDAIFLNVASTVGNGAKIQGAQCYVINSSANSIDAAYANTHCAYVSVGGNCGVGANIVQDAPPGIPRPASPASGATSQPLNVVLRWHPSDRAQTYRLQVSSDATFATPLINDSTLTDTVKQMSGLAINTKYYWCESAKNVGEASAYSAVWSFTTGTVVLVEELGGIPKEYNLTQNYPNPFNPTTTIRYGLPNRSSIRIIVTNTLGQEVAMLTNGEQVAGSHEVEWHANVASGIYFYRIDAVSTSDPNQRFVQVKKMLLLK